MQRTSDEGGGGLQSERFASYPLFERVLAGDVLLRFGCADTSAVEILQQALSDFGFDAGPVDGIWGPLTNGGVLRFQGANGLGADGVIGPKTMASLDAAQPSPAPPDTGEESLPGELDAESIDLGLLQSFLGLDETSGPLGAVGKVEAHENSGQKDGRIQLCRGAADYQAIVEGSGNKSKWRKEWADHRLNTNKNDTQKPYRKGTDFKQSWCQYFTGWARKMAGVSSKGKSKPADGKYTPKPGDTGYREKNDLGKRVDHEGVVIASDGKTVVSVDGNVDPKSNILVRYHQVTWWDHYYATFPD